MRARIAVTLKSGVLDPQGKAIEGALASLGIRGIESVRQGKLFDIELADGDEADLAAALSTACERLLANTVIETYRIDIDGDRQPPAASSVETEQAAEAAEMPAEGRP